MKTILTFLISAYQVLGAPLLQTITGRKTLCRYSPSCSEYTKQMIKKNGIIQGIRMGLRQFIRCHPFAKDTYGKSI